MPEHELTKGYEFVDGEPRLRPTFDYERIMELASAPDEHGWQILELTILKGETAWNPGSTKHVIHGPARVRYEIHPSGVRGVILDG